MSESKFYDLHVTGLGYLNRVRLVKPSKGDSFLACSISALRGEWNKDGSIKPESTKFDVRVYGQDAIKAIEALNEQNPSRVLTKEYWIQRKQELDIGWKDVNCDFLFLSFVLHFAFHFDFSPPILPFHPSSQQIRPT